jgi:hypothetical protein
MSRFRFLSAVVIAGLLIALPIERAGCRAETLRFEPFNLLVKLPGEPWEQTKPAATDTRARLVVSRLDPNVVISLAADCAPAGINETNATVVSKSQAKLLQLPDGAIVPGEEEILVNGIEGIRFKAFALVENRVPVHYSVWVATRNGYKYNVAAYGEWKDREAIDEALLRFLGGIKQIEPHRVASKVATQRQR